MKTIKYLVLISILAFSTNASAQSKNVKTSIKVFGNCGMCKNRIETALDHKGIKFANWDIKSKQLELVYSSNKISEKEIHEIIASIGHDTEKVKAKTEVYSELPFCCLYRDHDHSGITDKKKN